MVRGRPYNAAIAGAQKWAAMLHASVFRATGGRIGGRMVGSPVLLLVTTGRKSGRRGTTVLPYLEVGGRKTHVRAAEARGEEKARLWQRLVRMYPSYEDYQKRTDREIPVILLEPS